MKRLVAIFLVMIIVVLSFGCTNNSANRFSDLSFDDELSNKEYNELLEKMEDAFIGFSKITISYEDFEKYGQVDNKDSMEFTVKAYNNYLAVIEGKSTKRVDEEGIRYTSTSKATMDIWADDTLKMIITHHAEDGEDDYYAQGMYTEENASDKKKQVYQYFYEYLQDILDFEFDDLKGYKLKGGGYALANSNKNESYAAVAWGNETRERYNLNESQIVVIIDKDYRITEITMYSSGSTNRDPDTNEWYSSTRKISGTSATIKVTYGSRKDDTQKVSNLTNGYKEYVNKKGDE